MISGDAQSNPSPTQLASAATPHGWRAQALSAASNVHGNQATAGTMLGRVIEESRMGAQAIRAPAQAADGALQPRRRASRSVPKPAR